MSELAAYLAAAAILVAGWAVARDPGLRCRLTGWHRGTIREAFWFSADRHWWESGWYCPDCRRVVGPQ